jgi:hypothetical protein
MTPQQLAEAQLGLATKYGRTQEAHLFAQQASGLRRDATQESQFDQQMAWNEQQADTSQQRFEQERQDRLEQTSIDRNLRMAQLYTTQQNESRRLSMDEQAFKDAQTVKAAQDAYATSYNEAVSSGNYATLMNPPEGVDPGAWNKVLYENVERDLGIPRQQLTSTSSRLAQSVNSLVGREFENPQEQFQAWQGLVNELYDSDYSDGVPVEIVDIPMSKGGGFLIREGSREVARVASLDELGTMAQGALEKDPLGAALGVELNARAADARAQARFERDLEVLKLQAPDKRAAIKALSDLKSDLTWGGTSAADKITRENEIRELWGLPLLKGAQGLTQRQNDPLSSFMNSLKQGAMTPGGLAGR